MPLFPSPVADRPATGKSRIVTLRPPGNGLPQRAEASPKARRLAELRRAIAGIENTGAEGPEAYLSLGLPQIHRHLPGPGLPCGALHEAIAATHGDTAASFGFALALMARGLHARRGPAFLVVSRPAADFGRAYGHGLRQFDIDVGRLLLVETRAGKDALWAMEEILRSQAGAAVVAGALESTIDLTTSRRLNLAAATSGTPLLLMRPPTATGTSAAATRWRIATAPSGRDRFDAFASWRWQVTLERCRNGRPGQWTLEWDHVAHRFHMVEVLADRALPARTGPTCRRRAVD
jgi:protein ImuA